MTKWFETFFLQWGMTISFGGRFFVHSFQHFFSSWWVRPVVSISLIQAQRLALRLKRLSMKGFVDFSWFVRFLNGTYTRLKSSCRWKARHVPAASWVMSGESPEVPKSWSDRLVLYRKGSDYDLLIIHTTLLFASPRQPNSLNKLCTFVKEPTFHIHIPFSPQYSIHQLTLNYFIFSPIGILSFRNFKCTSTKPRRSPVIAGQVQHSSCSSLCSASSWLKAGIL